MKIKPTLLWTFVMLLSISAMAQTLSPVVISSSGGFYSAGGNTLSVTVAEMTMVQTFVQPASMLTQGFQQPEQLTTSVTENEAAQGEVVIYPNPSNGQFNISYNALNEGDCRVVIYNMAGQLVFDQSYGAAFGPNTIQIDAGGFGQGIYMLQFRSADQNGKQKNTIHKINLVY